MKLVKYSKEKKTVYAYRKKARVPYTIIDIGVWHEVVIPRVPSGRLDRAAVMGRTFLVGAGEACCATTAIEDIGRFVASIIVDPRTLSRYVFAYVFSIIWQKAIVQFLYNNWVKGDNESSYTKYLGYLDAHDLYPDLKVKPLKKSVREAFANGQDFASQVGDDPFWSGLEKLLFEEEK
ncbi:uncharacterized protein KD926_008095 [Aspergillus affinis]|uniref:uncharacterized protein n=1 Tax=Aspergillus affinis TaxID=1070780 RepID=UPI0022FF275C|nr:uncharacterized protein KD926_008095 [Aspergillus affinis]KAI9040529.1 hypothetical protein KD926_008095 [Aspergillus affinis]